MSSLKRGISTMLMAGFVTAAASVLAQSSGGDFELTRSTIDAGGGSSSGSLFELNGTIAQPEANPQSSSGGEFVVAGGFWANASDVLFADSFEGN